MNEKKLTILLVLGRGETIRNFVLSGMAAYLRQYVSLAAIAVFPNDEIREILENEFDELYELKNIKRNRISGYLHDWIDIVHGRFLWSGVAQWRWKLRDHEAKEKGKTFKRSMQKIVALPFASAGGIEFLDKIERIQNETISPSNYYLDLLKKINPDHVFNGSHIHNKNTLPIMHAANKLGLKTSTFLFSWDNLTSQGRILPSYNKYIVWNESIKKDLLSIYRKIKEEDVYISGTPQFDFHFKKENFWSREIYCAKIGADPHKPIILYTTGMLNIQVGEEAVLEGIADRIAEMPEPRPQLVVRVYPKDTTGRFDLVKARRPDIIFPKIPWEKNYLTPMPEDLVLWTNMLIHCEMGINVASTVSLELCMFSKPCLNVAYNPPGLNIYPKDYPSVYQWEHYVPLTNSGALYIAYSEAEIVEMIKDALAHPLKYEVQQKQLIEKFFGDKLDGKSYLRIADKLLEWAGLRKN